MDLGSVFMAIEFSRPRVAPASLQWEEEKVAYFPILKHFWSVSALLNSREGHQSASLGSYV